MMSLFDLTSIAESLPTTWRSTVIGRAAESQIKVLRMDSQSYPNETHDFDEALLVIEGQMNLLIDNQTIEVKQGQMYIVPSGIPHAVAHGSHGTLVIIDR
jgi:quercetin dioxygenase-like cupin family protein